MDREGTFKTEFFDRYQRSEKALVLSLMEMYLEGVSTRKVTDITEVLCGTGFSKSTVSRLAGQLDADVLTTSVDVEDESTRGKSRHAAPTTDNGVKSSPLGTPALGSSKPSIIEAPEGIGTAQRLVLLRKVKD